MFRERHFHVVCLLVFSVFQYYQAFSSAKAVFYEYSGHFTLKIKFLTAFHVFGFVTSSTLLIFGAIKLKTKYIASALPYLVYKVGFFFWHLRQVIEITIGCEETRESYCDTERLWKFYIHIFIFRKLSIIESRYFNI